MTLPVTTANHTQDFINNKQSVNCDMSGHGTYAVKGKNIKKN